MRAASGDEGVHLLFGFDPLCHDPHAELLAQSNHGLNDRP